VTIVDLLVMLAQGDARVVRVPIPPRLCGATPSTRIRTLENRVGRALTRSLALHPRGRVLEARAGDLVLKRYLVGLGDRLLLHGGGMYALDHGYAYVIDPVEGGLALRDQDVEEVFEYAEPGARLLVAP